jgi:hypothetical protein
LSAVAVLLAVAFNGLMVFLFLIAFCAAWWLVWWIQVGAALIEVPARSEKDGRRASLRVYLTIHSLLCSSGAEHQAVRDM